VSRLVGRVLGLGTNETRFVRWGGQNDQVLELEAKPE
jgi:hypothetical protein